MLEVFLRVILPTFMVAGAGAGLQRWRKLPVGPLSQLMLYLLAPALVINSVLNADIQPGASLRVVGVSLAATLAGLVGAALVSGALRHSRALQAGFVLGTGFPNAGNMALPITLLAFGQPGLSVAVILFVTQSATGWLVGGVVAARSGGASMSTAVRQVARMPMMYGAFVGLALRGSGITLPFAIARPIEMLGQAAIPLMLLILGFQLSQGIDWARWRSLLTAVGWRLLVGPAIALGIALASGLEGVALATVVVVSGMPTGVFTTILATEFKAEPRFVTSAVVATTLASLATLTVLITLMQHWD